MTAPLLNLVFESQGTPKGMRVNSARTAVALRAADNRSVGRQVVKEISHEQLTRSARSACHRRDGKNVP